ncbi:Rieske 2Fe-2S domain-containing protein [Flammeovirga kamogawensis]|uniref:Ferric reductase-like transmembrane domain-containing protein n=1 Tax=Flammeovirga kamogawensis TaxID=373891 RepID=A0ABX8GUG2_9BACT|nr:ferric reductase-like transmembrane domain-containing protein [Flammeovirga kamogawensis]MBB6459898.1 nitrite reductase/ring-hydroxylating ferredoxin subunit/DMSO/TMAO reductase YedYZ heme-binding membrane subunit [Flammeovirga kamogawensis]QWG07049.1 ferric reductase-like transmembrane domain-containing protein [Flammeovirga kamogawensis]TRX68871.1 Rieske 2Fe-2S domain-containing protein [Flammeovirga kamogawensis]
MSHDYQAVLWNPQKKKYDQFIVLGVIIYLVSFATLTLLFDSNITIETLIIRAFGSLAIILLQLILSIGPLTRLNRGFMPLLYNRRHLGVVMFLIATVHGVFSLIQFHALGDSSIIDSLFKANQNYATVGDFPFQTLGFFALIILFTMASTSHDFWNTNLGPRIWKIIHMFVYLAYLLIVFHVLLGAYQQHHSTYLLFIVSAGSLWLIGLHLYTGFLEVQKDKASNANLGKVQNDGYLWACTVEDIQDNCAKVIQLGSERIAVFKYDNKIAAVSNVCEHQNGPLGEGKVIDGCITCPWHGYQYKPEDGQSPPPFTEKIHTFKVRLEKNNIYVYPSPLPKGTPTSPAIISI